jgi:hypothetical protein
VREPCCEPLVDAQFGIIDDVGVIVYKCETCGKEWQEQIPAGSTGSDGQAQAMRGAVGHHCHEVPLGG